MGNAIYYCMVQPATAVRVMRADGEVLEFDQPVVAKQLMKLYPGHLVVHCSQVSRSSGLGHRSKVLMLRADDSLQLGQTYCLLRVPAQRGKVLPPADGDVVDAETLEQQLQYRLASAGSLHQQLPFGAPWRPHLDVIIESPLHSNASSGNIGIIMSPLARQAGYVPMSPLREPASLSPLRASSSEQSA